MKRWFAILVLSVAVTNAGLAQENVLTIAIKSGDQEYRDVPVCVPLSVSGDWAKFEEVAVDLDAGGDSVKIIGQLTAPGIMTESIKPAKKDLIRRDLHVIVPRLKAKQEGRLLVRFEKSDLQIPRFAWSVKDKEYAELILTRSGTFTPVLRFMNRPYDISSPEARNKSYKVFHHLYDPAGKRFVTNGGFADNDGTDPKKLLYPHHRGIMYGFNKCSYGPDLKLHADTWHCPSEAEKKKKPATPAAHVATEKYLRFESGPVLGRQRVLLGWFGDEKEPFAREERELTVYRVPGGTLVEFASLLKTTAGKVRVDGDPQHAGFQFRAANEVALKTKAATYYLHPDGKGEKGKERNWPQDKAMVDLPWYALSFVLDDQRYTVCYLNSPGNPKESRFSERDYGRFGGYFQKDITPETPLIVDYRLWLQTGEMTPQQTEALYRAFASPPQTSVK